MMNYKRPLIGITMRYDVASERFYLSRDYTEAIESAGGVPIHIPLIPQYDLIHEITARLDGVLLPGSASDVDPHYYGHEPHRMLGSVHALRDETDRLVLAEIERRALPLLAICYGMQMLNVWRGGTLIQDIYMQIPHAIKHQQEDPRHHRSHQIKFLPKSQLADLAGSVSSMVNSHHHQAIHTIGKNLRATAWTSDGLIEAVEDSRADSFALGVQWHPEVNNRVDDFSQAIFARFIQAAAKRHTGKTILSEDLGATQLADSPL